MVKSSCKNSKSPGRLSIYPSPYDSRKIEGISTVLVFSETSVFVCCYPNFAHTFFFFLRRKGPAPFQEDKVTTMLGLPSQVIYLTLLYFWILFTNRRDNFTVLLRLRIECQDNPSFRFVFLPCKRLPLGQLANSQSVVFVFITFQALLVRILCSDI